MSGNPDAIHGPSYEEAVIWQENASDPTTSLRQQFVTGKGLVVLDDGVVRSVGEGRAALWQPPVDERDVDTPPGSPATGYRVIVGDSPTGDFVGHEGEIAHYNGSAWVFVVPQQGTALGVKSEGELYHQTESGTAWVWEKVGVDYAPVTGEPTGFPNRTDSTISFVDGTRTFSVAPAVSSFSIFASGVEFEKTISQDTVIADTEGMHYLYFDTDGVLQSSTTWSDDYVLQDILSAIVYWDSTNSKSIYLGEERHGVRMDGATHLHWHKTFGTSFYSGLALNSLLTDEDGSLDTHAQFGTDAGVIADEDIVLSLSAKTAPAQIGVLYRTGASGYWRLDTATNFAVKSFSGGSGRLAWNQWTGSTWQQSEVTNNGFVLCHLFAINDTTRQWYSVQGINQYSNVASAQQGALVELNNLVLDGLPSAEFIAVATLIFQTSNSFSNSKKARIRTTEDGGDWVDWRYEGVSPVSVASDSISADTHKTLRQIIHFIDEGPAEGFLTGAYKETLPTASVFPTSIIWWKSSSKLEKLVERTITWTGVNPTNDEWKIYDTDGSTLLATVSDSISYSGVFETTRTRTITVA